MANFGSVELNVEKRSNGESIVKQTYLPTINIGNAPSNSFGNPEQQSLEFDVTEQGDYVIAIYSAASEWSDCIVGQLSLTADSFSSTGIKTIEAPQFESDVVYDLQGRKVSVIRKGIYIRNGKKILIK